MDYGIFRKNYSISYKAIHDDCVVAFNGGYEKYLEKNNFIELMWIGGIQHNLRLKPFNKNPVQKFNHW